MPLLKADNVPTTTRVFQMRDVEQHAAGLIEQAKQKAAAILSRADVEADRMREEARAEGHAAGRNAGEAEGRTQGEAAGKADALQQHGDQLTQLISVLGNALAEIESHRQSLADEAAADIARLAVAVAEKIAKRQGSLDTSVVEYNITAAARAATDAHDVRLVLNPAQAKHLADTVGDLALRWPTLHRATIVEDASITPGGCRLLAVGCEVDATLETQLDRLAAELLPE